MAINKEIWTNYITTNLFRGMEWVKYSKDFSQYVTNKTVHAANAGAIVSVSRNRTQGSQASVSQITNYDVNFSLDELTTKPILVTNLEECELNFDKLSHVLNESISSIRQTAGDWMAYNFRPRTGVTQGGIINILRSSGTSTTSHYVSNGTSTTGSRNKLCLADIQAARLVLNKQNCLKDNRYLLVDSTMLSQLMDELTVTTNRDYSRAYDLQNGVIARIYDFNIIERSSVLGASSGSNYSVTFRSPSDTGYATDNACALFWQSDALASAVGDINVFENSDDPTYYGTILSTLVRLGGVPLRSQSDHYGIGAICQT